MTVWGRVLGAALLLVSFSIGSLARAQPRPAPRGPSAHRDVPDTLTLAEAYERALAYSDTLRTSQQATRDARVSYAAALAVIGPTVTAKSIGTIENENTQPFMQGSAALTLIQPIFRRNLFPARAAAREAIAATEATLHRTREQVYIDTIEAFMAVVEARAEQVLVAGGVARTENILAVARARIKAGGSLPSAEPLAAVAVEASRIRLTRAEGTTRDQEVTFERIVGVPPPARLITPPPPSAGSVEELLAQSRNRNDLRALRFQTLQSRELEASLAGQIFWPQLDFQGSATYSRNYWQVPPTTTLVPGGPRVPVFEPSTFAIGKLVLTIPIFQTGTEWSALYLQKGVTLTTSYQEALLGKQVTEQVKRAAVDLDVAIRAAALADSQLQVARQYFELVQRQMKLGAITWLEVTISSNTLIDAEVQHTVTAYTRDISVYRLLFAAGLLRP